MDSFNESLPLEATVDDFALWESESLSRIIQSADGEAFIGLVIEKAEDFKVKAMRAKDPMDICRFNGAAIALHSLIDTFYGKLEIMRLIKDRESRREKAMKDQRLRFRDNPRPVRHTNEGAI